MKIVHPKPERQNFATIHEKAHHEVRSSEEPALAFHQGPASQDVTRTCSCNPSYETIGKAEVGSNDKNESRSHTQSLPISQGRHSSHSTDVAPLRDVRAHTTGPTPTLTAALSAQSSSTSSLLPSLNINTTRLHGLEWGSPASFAVLPFPTRLCYLFAIPWIIPSALAATDSAISTPQSGLIWPFNEGPPGLLDFVFVNVTAILILAFILIDKKFPQLFSGSVVGGLLLGLTGGGFVVIGDPTTTNTFFLSYGALQVFLGQSFAKKYHSMGSRQYKMSVHFWPLIFVATLFFDLVCMEVSPNMYSQNTHMTWFRFTVPCFGVAVGACVYFSCLLQSWNHREPRSEPNDTSIC